ncbi:hypothetical protein EV653_1585 [Kribbella pratensis]|uniref:Acetyltransferase (GNAT) family protein n=1 Tax=Kribbella pratensis TaxID=2512112 RepID=A0A4R8CJ03_9ACTN|nr:hypothetical protein EV653_1585 [Kribbella pratensis]
MLTDRLALRWPVQSDYPALCTLWTDSRVARFMDDYRQRDPKASATGSTPTPNW